MLFRSDTDASTERLLHSLDHTSPKPVTCKAKLGKAEIGFYLMGKPFFSNGEIGLVDLRDQAKVPLCTRR